MLEAIAIIVVLIVASMAMVLLEMLSPSFGIFTGLGLLAMAGAAWTAFAYVSSAVGWVLVVATFLIIPTYFVLLTKVLPNLPGGRRLFLSPRRQATDDKPTDVEGERKLIGHTGIAETPLRPSGMIRIEGRRRPALSERGTVGKGARVKVIGNDGINLIVREVLDEA
jgi:membrane-bound serine protease (ClpP class)